MKRKGLNQRLLGLHMGVTESTVSKWFSRNALPKKWRLIFESLRAM
jgi:hypothetical protein